MRVAAFCTSQRENLKRRCHPATLFPSKSPQWSADVHFVAVPSSFVFCKHRLALVALRPSGARAERMSEPRSAQTWNRWRYIPLALVCLSSSHTALPDMDNELSDMTDRLILLERARSICVEWVYRDCRCCRPTLDT